MQPSSEPPERLPMHSTYKMPPLTPTVANLIHTSSVVKKSYSNLGSRTKVMKPGTDSSYIIYCFSWLLNSEL